VNLHIHWIILFEFFRLCLRLRVDVINPFKGSIFILEDEGRGEPIYIILDGYYLDVMTGAKVVNKHLMVPFVVVEDVSIIPQGTGSYTLTTVFF
jgi:hypothetical protein